MTDLSYAQNIVLNMSGGLLPKDLSEDEVEALREEYGENWFEELDYSEEEYEKPEFN